MRFTRRWRLLPFFALLASACGDGTSALVLGRPGVNAAGGAGAAGAAFGGPRDAAGAGGSAGGELTGGAANEAGASAGGFGGEDASTGGTAPTTTGGTTGAGAGSSAQAGAANGGAGSGGSAGAGWLDWAASACSPQVVVDNRDAAGDGRLFDEAVPNAQELVQRVALFTCRTLYRQASEVPPVPTITIVVEASTLPVMSSGPLIVLGSGHLRAKADEGADLYSELEGVLQFAIANVYQHDADGSAPGWLVTGIADFVRQRSGLHEPAPRSPDDSYLDGYRTAAAFLAWLDAIYGNVVYRLNQRLADGGEPWTDAAFQTITGKDLDTLWAQYQSTL